MAARIVLGCLTLLVALPAAPLPAQVAAPPPSSRIFRFDADGFWLSLHHFLYVLGRAEIGTPDRARRAVAGAPADQTQGLASLSADDQALWKRAVSFYAAGPSKWCATDIFEARELSRDGVVVVVRPDQYVAAILPLDAVAELDGFLAGAFVPAR